MKNISETELKMMVYAAPTQTVQSNITLRVECENRECGVLLEVCIPVSETVPGTPIAVRCGNCSNLLHITLKPKPPQLPAQVIHVTASLPPASAHLETTQQPATSASIFKFETSRPQPIMSRSANRPAEPEHHSMQASLPMDTSSSNVSSVLTTAEQQLLNGAMNATKKKAKDKKPRDPSMYNLFIRDEIPRLKARDKTLDHKSAFKLAATNWSKSHLNPRGSINKDRHVPDINYSSTLLHDGCVESGLSDIVNHNTKYQSKSEVSTAASAVTDEISVVTRHQPTVGRRSDTLRRISYRQKHCNESECVPSAVEEVVLENVIPAAQCFDQTGNADFQNSDVDQYCNAHVELGGRNSKSHDGRLHKSNDITWNARYSKMTPGSLSPVTRLNRMIQSQGNSLACKRNAHNYDSISAHNSSTSSYKEMTMAESLFSGDSSQLSTVQVIDSVANDGLMTALMTD